MDSCSPKAGMGAKLGIIAGSGSLPRKIIEAAERQGRPCLVVGFPGQTDPETLAAAPSFVEPLGAARKIAMRFKKEGITDLVLAGGIKRPSLLQVKPDWTAARLLAKATLHIAGDDGMLRFIIREIEERGGFRVLSPQEITGDLLMPAGVLGKHKPDQQADTDIKRGLTVAKTLGRVDVGQSVVVQQGLVLGVEAIEGTDALLARCGGLAREGKGGILIKAMKPGQERRADLPAIGIQTIVNADAAGLRGVAVEAGSALLIDRRDTIREADGRGLFLVGIEGASAERDGQ